MMRINHHHQRGGGGRIQSNQKITFFLVFVGCIILISQETDYINSSSGGIKGEWLQSDNEVSNNNVRREQISTHNKQSQQQQQQQQQNVVHQQHMNHFSLCPGELPGYTGWSRPEQTLAGYFDIHPLSHRTNNLLQSKYHSTVNSGDKFSILLTCNNKVVESEEDEGPPYECPPGGGTLFYVRAYGPNVITGLVTDHYNSSYSIEMQFIDPGEYTLEVVTTFSVPLDYNEFPIDDEDESSIEPGYEGYLVSGFPLSILVHPREEEVVDNLSQQKPWCTLAQLTESSPQSALYKGHWEVIDTVARLSHQPLTPDETQVSLDGYRMGLNSVGVRMAFEYEDCELIHIRDLAGGFHGGVDVCFNEHLGFNIPLRDRWLDNSTEAANQTTLAIDNDGNSTNINFEGVHVIFIGDSVMRLTRYFFLQLVKWSRGIKVTMIETNGGIHATLQDITTTLETIRQEEEGANVKRVIIFNSGLHDVDILCSSKRKRSRNGINITNNGQSCQEAYREGMTKFIHMLDDYPAEMKVFRSTTAGKVKRCMV